MPAVLFSAATLIPLLFASAEVEPTNGASPAATADAPGRNPEQLIVASYNVRRLGEKGKDHDALARVIRNFDICGLIEIQNPRTAVLLAERLQRMTRRPWGFAHGAFTRRPGGTYKEAFGVLWRRDRVTMGGGLMGNYRDEKEKFRHDPFITSFRRGNFDFMTILVHTRWTNDKYGTRKGEVLAAADLVNGLRKRYRERDILLMGDFNYSGKARVMRRMARLGDLVQLDPNTPSTFKRNHRGYANSYDHIYASRNTAQREFIPGRSRVLDVTRYLYKTGGTKAFRKSRTNLSDHLPVWAVFHVTGSDDD